MVETSRLFGLLLFLHVYGWFMDDFPIRSPCIGDFPASHVWLPKAMLWSYSRELTMACWPWNMLWNLLILQRPPCILEGATCRSHQPSILLRLKYFFFWWESAQWLTSRQLWSIYLDVVFPATFTPTASKALRDDGRCICSLAKNLRSQGWCCEVSMYVYVCMYMYACLSVCLSVCLYVCMYVRTYVTYVRT